jgi:hypothetical protein
MGTSQRTKGSQASFRPAHCKAHRSTAPSFARRSAATAPTLTGVTPRRRRPFWLLRGNDLRWRACPSVRTSTPTLPVPPRLFPERHLRAESSHAIRHAASRWTAIDRRATVREAAFTWKTPLLDARSSADVASLRAFVAPALSFAAMAARTRFTRVRTELVTARLRTVRVMRWRFRFSADG